MNKMAIVHRVGAMLMLFLFPGISWAQEQKVQSVTLDLKTAIGIALNENPTIKVADVEIEKKDYSFGNIQYHEELDRVHITIYDDVVEISCTKEARGSYERKLDKRKKYTSEDKIISALDFWRCNFGN